MSRGGSDTQQRLGRFSPQFCAFNLEAREDEKGFRIQNTEIWTLVFEYEEDTTCILTAIKFSNDREITASLGSHL